MTCPKYNGATDKENEIQKEFEKNNNKKKKRS